MHAAADVTQLVVTHRLKDARRAPGTLPGSGLVLDTCLRELSLDLRADKPRAAGAEIHAGVDAYCFTLEVTTGLRSAVAGETNVYGQFKDAWQSFRAREAPARVARLAPLVHAIVNDTKEIRRTHLQGIGGHSYGTLVRRLINPAAGERVLFVGAGNLAHSMLPLFRHFARGLWNHRPADVSQQGLDEVFAPDDGARAARWADHVVLATPPDANNDDHWRRWLSQSGARTIVHLGHRRGHDPIAAGPGVRLFNFDDVIEIQNAQADIRARQLEQARRACRQRAGVSMQAAREPGFANLRTA